MKLINWLKAVWISFQVAQNSRRLVALTNLLGVEYARAIPEDRRVTLVTYRNVVRWFLDEHPGLTDNIWPLEHARGLFRRTKNLIAIGEMILYGSD